MKTKQLASFIRKLSILFTILVLVFTAIGCEVNDPNTENWYQRGDLYVWNSDVNDWILVNTLSSAPSSSASIWYAAAGVPTPELGSNTDLYLNTTNSDIYQKTADTWVFQVNIKGEQGIQGNPGEPGENGIDGTDGATWYSNTTVPDSELGIDNDFYLNTSTYNVYKKISGNWTIIVNIKGATGDTGATGTDGEDGQGFNWRGTWESGEDYSPYDITYSEGNSYVCILTIVNSTNAPKNDPTHFDLFAGILEPEPDPTLREYLTTGSDAYQPIWGNNLFAQTFTTTAAYKIYSVKLLLYRTGDAPDITVSIRATASDLPLAGSANNLCSGTTTGSTLPTTSPYEWREIVLGDGYNLSATTKYAIVVTTSGQGDASNYVRWRVDTSSPPYTGGNVCNSVNDITWNTTAPDQDALFEVWGRG